MRFALDPLRAVARVVAARRVDDLALAPDLPRVVLAGERVVVDARPRVV
ncbi:MAG: hypothetical protein GX607_19880, partial [Myxococcales bacterium]|nr:hypothetical protein [Myxococcales bacterium]